MTAPAPLTVDLAGALGEAVARRLPVADDDPTHLAEAAAQALQQLLTAPAAVSGAAGAAPTTTPTAVALRQLVLLPEFAAFLAADAAPQAGPPAANPRRQALIERCHHTFAPELLPPLLAFSDSCRAARSAQAPGSGGFNAAGIGNLAGLALAIPLFFAIGWMGHRWLNRQADDFTLAPSTLDALRNAPAPATPGQLPTPPRPGSPAAGLPPLPQAAPAATSAALACLSEGQREVSAPADPSNYDPRESVNWKGEPVPSRPQLIVLHETVVDKDAALALFQRRNSQDSAQASYHVLIDRNGQRIRVVDDDQRAFGAGDSEWNGFSVQLRPNVRSSVNNIALHVSLVSPSDGADGEARGHSGYTPEQYRSLANQIALWQNTYGIPADRIVTHEEVDRSGTRRDPRSLDWEALRRNLQDRLLACGGSAPATAGQGAAPTRAPAP